ncbi:hypothetical protein [Mucilaginibacter sp. L196]|uniref:hypothetical protein n=1 Tax=Mucilaginibacter sp. L196 TaxID=1641870 RepID=UPI00131E26EC|nr:hypothetical protein [Mucilaginibacter sp. L196]
MQSLTTSTNKITTKKLIIICLLVSAVYHWRDIKNGFVDGMTEGGLNFKTTTK